MQNYVSKNACSQLPKCHVNETGAKLIMFTIPNMSAHSQATFESIVAGELNRLLLTNSKAASFEKHKAFFKDKLCKKGYNMRMVNRISSKFPFSRRFRVTAPGSKQKSSCRHVYFSTKFVLGLDKGRFAHHLRRPSLFLRHHLGPESNLRVAYRVGRNLFRILHRHMWQGGRG